MVKCLSFLIILATSMQLCAQVVPFRGNLNPEAQELYSAVEKLEKKGSRAAIDRAFALAQNLKSKKTSEHVWSQLTYAALLTENDSVSKARSILLDSAGLNLESVEAWLGKLHSINYSEILALDGKYTLAEDLLRGVLVEDGDDELRLHASMALAENLRFQGKLDVSRINWYESLKLSKELNDSSLTAECHRGRGIVFFLLERLDDARADFEFYQKYAVSVGNRKKEANAISLLGLLDYQNGNHQSAIDKALSSYDIRKRINDFKGQGESLNNLALGYMGLRNWNQALRYLEEAVQLKTLSSDLSQMTVILNNMGHCHQKLNNHKEAQRYFDLALEKGWRNGQMGDVINSHYNLIGLSEGLGKYEEAFRYQTRLLAIKDSLSQLERANAIDELEVQFETDKKEQEILMLQQRQTIITNRWLTIALGLFLAIIIGVLILDNQKRKHRQETELLTAEDELQKAELKIMADLLEHNQQKLSLYTENLLKKNELVGQLETRLKSAVENVGDEIEGQKLLTNFSGVRILTDEDWEEFKDLFDGVHRGMLDRLLQKYENLTLAEQRLFLLMKLEMSTKEIANILGVSPDSVKKGRYRLKKKINLEDNVSLQEFVSAF